MQKTLGMKSNYCIDVKVLFLKYPCLPISAFSNYPYNIVPAYLYQLCNQELPLGTTVNQMHLQLVSHVVVCGIYPTFDSNYRLTVVDCFYH